MKTKRLILLSVLFMALFNEPVLSIINRPELLAGLPLTYAYILLVWGLMIVAMIVVLYKNRNTDDSFSPDE